MCIFILFLFAHIFHIQHYVLYQCMYINTQDTHIEYVGALKKPVSQRAHTPRHNNKLSESTNVALRY